MSAELIAIELPREDWGRIIDALTVHAEDLAEATRKAYSRGFPVPGAKYEQKAAETNSLAMRLGAELREREADHG